MVLLRVISSIRTHKDFKIFCKYTTGEQVVFDLNPMIDAALQKPDGYTEALANKVSFNEWP
jgi:hypothetical protein